MDITQGAIGTGGKYDLSVDATGKVVVTLNFSQNGLDANMTITYGVMDVLQKLADASASTWDNTILELVKAVLASNAK